jgi:hypothetical protein
MGYVPHLQTVTTLSSSLVKRQHVTTLSSSLVKRQHVTTLSSSLVKRQHVTTLSSSLVKRQHIHLACRSVKLLKIINTVIITVLTSITCHVTTRPCAWQLSGIAWSHHMPHTKTAFVCFQRTINLLLSPYQTTHAQQHCCVKYPPSDSKLHLIFVRLRSVIFLKSNHGNKICLFYIIY